MPPSPRREPPAPSIVAEANLRKAMVEDANEMLGRLTLAVALSRDAPLHDQLRGLAGLAATQGFQVRLPESELWLSLAGDRLQAILRRPDPALPQIDFEAAAAHSEVRQAMIDGIRRSGAHAAAFDLLSPLFSAAAAPSRSQVSDILAWSPIVERVAYRFCTRSSALLDLLRPGLLTAPGVGSPALDARRAAYWATAHTSSHVSLLASAVQARPWLAHMADQFEWVTWTPTFPLLRERTLWLAAAAARSARAFGEPVVEKYLAALALATHPVKRFDALFGLVAIGLSWDDGAGTLIAALEARRAVALRQERLRPGLTRVMFESALGTLRDPVGAARQYAALYGDPALDPAGLFTRATLRADPTDILHTTNALGFIALAALAPLAPEACYPTVAGPDPVAAVGAREIGQVLARAWGGAAGGLEAPLLH